jgi:energy-coupling factor transport system substrate-specific component
MKAAFSMWKNTRMIILVAVCAAIYGAALLAFKTAIPLIPGFTEVRIGNIFPMVFGVLFGPAGAWGTAFGNLISDIFGGTLTLGSIGGFIGNFLLGYLPYTMWTTLKPIASGRREPSVSNWRSWVLYILIALISSAACAVVISTGTEVFGLVPYTVLVPIITINDTAGSLIGGLLLLAVYTVVKKQLGLAWWDVMDEPDIGKPVAGVVGAWLVTAASIAAWVLGVYLLADQAMIIGILGTIAIILGSILM